MAKRRKKTETKKQTLIFGLQFYDVLRGVLVAAAFTVIAILLFALVIKMADVSAKVVTICNHIIKAMAVLLAVHGATKKDKKPGIIKGALTGLFYVLIGFGIMSLVAGGFGEIAILVSDCGFGVLGGGLIALIFGLIRKK